MGADPDEPIVELKLFGHRNFAYGTLLLVLAYAAFFGMNLLVPLWLQRALDYTAIWAGFATAPIGIFPVLLTFFIGKYGPRIDLRIMAAVAFVIIGATCLMRSHFNVQINYEDVALVQLLQGLGVALFFMPVLTILLSDLKGHEIASGSGLSTFLRTLGGSFAASITTFLWSRRAIEHHVRMASDITPYEPASRHAMDQLGHGNIHRAATVINRTITQQSFQMSFNDIMHVLGWVFIALVPILWLTRPPFHAKAR